MRQGQQRLYNLRAARGVAHEAHRGRPLRMQPLCSLDHVVDGRWVCELPTGEDCAVVQGQDATVGSVRDVGRQDRVACTDVVVPRLQNTAPRERAMRGFAEPLYSNRHLSVCPMLLG